MRVSSFRVVGKRVMLQVELNRDAVFNIGVIAYSSYDCINMRSLLLYVISGITNKKSMF